MDQLVGVGRHRHPGVALKTNYKAVMILRDRHCLLLTRLADQSGFSLLPSLTSVSRVHGLVGLQDQSFVNDRHAVNASRNRERAS